MKKLLFLLCLFTFFFGFSQNQEKDKKAIKKALKTQRIAWSKNNIVEFMESYWKSPSLKLQGKNGITYGWKNALEYYKKAYPSENHTGILNFKINDITQIDQRAYFVLGEYHIKRDVGNAAGLFMSIFKKINNEWKVIAHMFN